MKCYELTYQVDGLRIKGYLGLPRYADISEAEITETVRRVTGAPSLLPLDPIDDIVQATPARVETSKESAVRAIREEGTLDGPSTALPGLLYCRGGIGRVGLSRLEWISTFCHLGFVVFAPWYRGTLGTDGRDEFGGADQSDATVGLRILQELRCVARDQVSILGFSRGSINATQAALAQPSAAGLILWGGVADLAATYEERVDLRRMFRRVIGGTPTRFPERYRERSPIHFADRISLPTLVIHSTDDPQVSFHHGQDMYAALSNAGVPVTWHAYQGYAHHFDPLVRYAVMDRMLEWARGLRV